MRVRFWILLICMLVSVNAWTAPVILTQATINVYDMYFDPTTGLQHVMIHDTEINRDHILYYQVDGHNKVVYNSTLNDSHVVDYEGIKIIGTSNGNTLYAVFEGVYKHGRFTDLDQLFTESLDNGRTWSAMVPVPRKDMNDGCQRTGESILPIGDSGRLFIFYKVDCKVRAPVLSFVTRSPGSQVFSQEKVLREVYTYHILVHSMMAEATYLNTRPIVHLFWQETKSYTSRLMYISSSDNGLTWTTPLNVSVYPYAIGETVVTTSNPAFPSRILGTFAAGDYDYLKLFLTSDNGQSFTVVNGTTQKQTYFYKDMQTTGMAVCGTKDHPKLFILAIMSATKYEYVVWDLTTMQSQVHAHPFDHNGNFAQGVKLACHVEANNVILHALVAARNLTEASLFLAQDTQSAM